MFIKQSKLSGVFTALITPFSADGKEVDWLGFEKNIEDQIIGGVTGIVPLGTTGETPTLTADEQKKIVEFCLKKAAGRVLVAVGTGSNSTAKTIENTRQAQEMGADLALVVTPYYNKPTQEGIFLHFQALSQNTQIPVIIYNIQGRTGVNIETPTLQKIAQLPHMVAVKEASGNVAQMSEVLETITLKRTAAQQPFAVLAGDDVLTLPLLALGGSGVISVASNVVPQALSQLVQAVQQNNWNLARELHFKMAPLFKFLFSETNPSPIKALMQALGKAAGPVRLPLAPLKKETYVLLENLLPHLQKANLR